MLLIFHTYPMKSRNLSKLYLKHSFFLKKIINLLHGARRQAVVDTLYLLR